MMESPDPEQTNAQSAHARKRVEHGALSSQAGVPHVEINGYEITGVLGSGAMGAVYKARHSKLNRDVAIKTILAPEMSAAQLRWFQREAMLLAQLQHPNIVAVYDYGICDYPPGRVYFAMELLDGEDYQSRLDRGRVGESTAWLTIRQAAAGLAHAAEQGIVHRDIKPSNLFLVPVPSGMRWVPKEVGFVKLTDFGVAFTPYATSEVISADATHTTDGQYMKTAAGVGTAEYMAPEQFDDSCVDLRADIYALGVIIFRSLAGELPFRGRSIWEIGLLKKQSPPPRLSPDVASEKTADLVAAMLAIDPKDRPQTYNDLIDRIEKLSVMKPPEEVEIPRRPIEPPVPAASESTTVASVDSTTAPHPFVERADEQVEYGREFTTVTTFTPRVTQRPQRSYWPVFVAIVLVCVVSVLAWVMTR